MVALTKKHFIGLLLGALALALLAAGVRIALSSRMHRHPPPVQHPVEDEIPGHPTPEKIGRVASVHPNFNVPASRIQELKAIFANVGEAYTNGQFEVARRRLVEIPDDFLTLLADPYREVTALLGVPFCDDFLFRHDKGIQARPLRDFTDVTIFTSYMRLNFELTRFFNDSDVKRAKLPNKFYEWHMLYQLKCYMKKFSEEGKCELEHAAKAFYDEWCEQVESKDGYTRQYMWDLMGDYLYTRKHRPDLWLSNRQIMEIVRHEADSLIKRGGYTPKWLDEEFPPPPEEESASPTKEVPR